MIIATPNALHVAQALACIAAGVAVLVEKPIAPSVADAQSLCLAVDASAARLLVGHHRAHSPILAKARQVVQQGLLGRLVAVTGTALFCKLDHYFADAPWRSQPGGGPILINLVHEIGNLRSLCGDIVAVQDRQLAHFCALMRGEVAPLVSARDGLQNLRVVEAIAESVCSGSQVAVAGQSG